MRARQEDQERIREPEAAAERAATPPAATLLALQRGAGNAAVARMLQRVITDPWEKAATQAPADTPSTTKDYEWDDSPQAPSDRQKRKLRQESARLRGGVVLPNEVDCPNYPVAKQLEVKQAAAAHSVPEQDAFNAVSRISWGLQGVSAGTVVWEVDPNMPDYLKWFPVPVKAGNLNINWEIVTDWVNPGLRDANAKHGKKGLSEIRELISGVDWKKVPNGQTYSFPVRGVTVVVKRFGDERWIWTVFG